MYPRKPHAPRIRYLPLLFGSEGKQFQVRKGNDFFLLSAVIAGEREFHIHGVGVTNGDGRLKPSELHAPFASERVRTGLELSRIICHFTPMLARVSSMTRGLFCRVKPPIPGRALFSNVSNAG